MDSLTNKTILLISPQPWGKMFLSKHHYAIELARTGNTVYFLCPLDEYKEGTIRNIDIRPSDNIKNLFFIHHRLFFPFQLKFHAKSLFYSLMKLQLRRIIKKIKSPIDIVWSFDLGNFFPFPFFDDKIYKIFHPVDEPSTAVAIEAARGANVLFSVTREIIEKYTAFHIPKYFINHGVADEFLLPMPITKNKDGRLRVGFSGNLTANNIDSEILLQIIKTNKEIIFDCWGAYSINDSHDHIPSSPACISFIRDLMCQENVLLHGAVSTHELAKGIRQVDAFLICYDLNKEQSRGTNYHKVMEFISTGKVIIANNISTYKDAPVLVQMVTERESNQLLPALFKKVMGDLSYYNSVMFQQERIAFAKDNTYKKQIRRIKNILTNAGVHSDALKL